ncbi:MATH domain and coiled-coil domain-containing protein At3g58220-like [Trifolium pratense]|uniref:MATH domain and coiled-coil domain-containing protein At3g58220-like n=1 Tax=Trifolium pratense TaxID=57577 RepID=UPI001E69807F|nr:MATH domain and coiled-coil domain-containing protein At3g58220-like [Trifolium pratense]
MPKSDKEYREQRELVEKENQESNDEIYEKFTWKIDNFSRLTNKVYHEHFVLAGYPWRVNLYPLGIHVVKSLSIYLEAMQTANMSQGWSRDVKFKLIVFDQLNTNRTITKDFDHEFNAKVNDKGSKSFMTLTELHNPNNGFLVKDTCIIGVEVFVRKSTHEKRVNQTVNLTTSLESHQTGHMEVETHSPFRDADDAELVFTLLGRVLHFLNIRKVKDMNEQACKELQDLWDELVEFRYDLTWLEPRVQSALGMKSYVERAMEVEKLKENVVVLKLETERLEAKLVAAEVNLEVERELLKEKGFKEMDLDSKLGCGSWRP